MRVVITRAEDRADRMAERLRSLGAEPIIYPTIAFAPPEDRGPLDAALQRLAEGGYDWLVLTSVTAVKVLAEAGLQIAEHKRLKLAAVGSATAATCIELLGVTPAVVPAKFVAEALAEALGDIQGQRVLLANADIARPTLEERLRTTGALVDRVIAYQTVLATDSDIDLPALLAAEQIGAITFTSGSTVRYFVQRIGPAALADARRTIIACIGPITADAARELGLPPTIIADPSTEEGLIEALELYVKQQSEDGAQTTTS
jgi:uroporphyrinogen-III synthase